jgi:hypothetical protein
VRQEWSVRLTGAEILLWCNAATGSAKLGSSNRLHHSASYAQANLMRDFLPAYMKEVLAPLG